ncbi:MAG: hypothetical protein IT480_15720 [Gammaproteobacteria bacterium]|nr:hypothetical protein [Gammaproteobacteria bacterium]
MKMCARSVIVGLGLAGLVAGGTWMAGPQRAAAAAPAPASSTAATKTVWYFYTVRWGKQDRYLELFRKNHYPLLEAQLGTRITSIRTLVPTYHGDGRADWTFAVELVFKDVATLTAPWADEQATIRRLFPDQETFQREERERFELLTAHWDVPVNDVAMK